MKKYYHMSREKLQKGTVLRPKNDLHVNTKVEEILSRRKPETSLDRAESVFLGETEDSAKHGLTYDYGYLHVVQTNDQVERRDNYWIGQLQLRHHSNRKMRNFEDRDLRRFTDEEIADKYWSGIESKKPNWEIATKSAFVVELFSEQVRIGAF
jgi:hypothetical protein